LPPVLSLSFLLKIELDLARGYRPEKDDAPPDIHSHRYSSMMERDVDADAGSRVNSKLAVLLLVSMLLNRHGLGLRHRCLMFPISRKASDSRFGWKRPSYAVLIFDRQCEDKSGNYSGARTETSHNNESHFVCPLPSESKFRLTRYMITLCRRRRGWRCPAALNQQQLWSSCSSNPTAAT
jgi:hypothetical protein